MCALNRLMRRSGSFTAPRRAIRLRRHVSHCGIAKKPFACLTEKAPAIMCATRMKCLTPRAAQNTRARSGHRFERCNDVAEPDPRRRPREPESAGAAACGRQQSGARQQIENLATIVRGNPHLAFHGNRRDQRVGRLLREKRHDAQRVFGRLCQHGNGSEGR